MHRYRQDLNYLTSAGLLVTGAVTAVSGLISDLWDLNDFWYHIVSGYLMGAFAIAHVILNWNRLISYARFRLRRTSSATGHADDRPSRARVRTAAVLTRGSAPEAIGPGAPLGRLALSRRGLLGLAAGGIGGWVLGQGLRPSPPIEAGSDVGVIYHQWSKPGIIDALGSVANWGQVPELYKAYPGAPRLALPPPALGDSLPTAEAISSRRSMRTYAPEAMTLGELSQVLFLTSGISAGLHGNARRTAPSSGALYPIEVYAAVHNVTGVERGVYHYAYREHALELVRQGDQRQAIVDQGLGQEFLGECGAVVFLTQILQRMRPKYQDRSYRYGLLEAGHIGENGYLAATAIGLGACGVGAFMDDQINAMLGVDGVDEAVVYMLAMGRVPPAA